MHRAVPGLPHRIRDQFSRRTILDTKPVTVVITCAIRPDELDTARRELGSVIKTVMANEPACRGIRVHEDPRNPRRLMIIESWDSEEIFTGAHMQMPHMQSFLKK